MGALAFGSERNYYKEKHLGLEIDTILEVSGQYRIPCVTKLLE